MSSTGANSRSENAVYERRKSVHLKPYGVPGEKRGRIVETDVRVPLSDLMHRVPDVAPGPSDPADEASSRGYTLLAITLVIEAINEALETQAEWADRPEVVRAGELFRQGFMPRQIGRMLDRPYYEVQNALRDYRRVWRGETLTAQEWLAGPEALPFLDYLGVEQEHAVDALDALLTEERQLGVTEPDIPQLYHMQAPDLRDPKQITSTYGIVEEKRSVWREKAEKMEPTAEEIEAEEIRMTLR